MEKLTPDGLEAALEAERAVIYKHSSRCAICSFARWQVERFADEHRDVRVFLLDVLGARDLSDRVAERLGVEHESPQAIVVRDGRAVWAASHFGVRKGPLERGLEAAGG